MLVYSLTVFKKIGDWHDAEAMDQETFVKVFEHLREIQEAEKLLNWMFSIAYRLSVDMHRAKQKRIEDISLSCTPFETKDLEVAAVVEQLAEYCNLENRLLTLNRATS